MKKFLFTLLTLFMASSAFAEGGNYFYMDNFKVVKTKLGTTTAKVTVKGHFDNYVSAWQFDLGYVNENGEVVMNQLPKGVTKLTSAAGADMKNMTYTGDDGEEYSDYSPNLKKGQDGTRIIVASDQADYSPEGEQYGPVKWVPGEYNQMWTFTFTCDADFTGAELVMRTTAACGNDTRPEVANNKATGVAVNAPNNCVVSVEYIAPEPVLTWDKNNYIMTATLPEGYNADDYEIVMMANGEVVESTYTVDQTSEEQEIVFTAYTKHAADETYDSNDATYGKETNQTVTVPAKVVEQTAKPNIAQENVEGGVKVTATGEGTVKLYVDGVEVDNPYVIAQTDVEKTYTVTATAQEEGKTISETATLEVTVPAKPAQTAKPVITPEETEDAVIVTATGKGTVVMYVNGVEVDNPVTFAKEEVEKTYTVTATAQEEGKTISETATLVVTVPAKPAEPGETKTFVKVTKADQLVVDKKYIIVCGNKAMGAAADGNFLAAVAITAGDEVEVGNDVAIMTLDGSLGHYTLAIDGKYLSAANSTGLSIGTSATEWAISDYNGTLAGYRVKHADYNRAVRYSSSYNRFGNYSTTDDNSKYAWIYVEKTAEPVLEDLTGEITIGDPDANGGVTVAYKGDEDVTLSVKVKDAQGNEVDDFTFVDGVVTLPDYGTYTVEVTATAAGYNDLTADKKVTWTKPEDPELGGYFVWSGLDANGQFTVQYNNYDLEEQGVTFTLVVTGEDGKTIEPMDGKYQAAEGTHTYTATVTATGYKDKSENHEYTYTKPNPAPVPTFNWDPDTYTMEAVCEGHTVVLMANGTEVTNPKTYTQTTEEQKINFSAYTVANDGETANSEIVYYAQNPVVIPALVLEQTAKPEIVVTNDDNFYYVTVKAVEGVATLYNAEGEAYTAEELPVKLERTDETYRVLFKADAIADGKTVSEQVTEMVSVAPKQLTGTITFSVTQGNKNNEAAGIVTATYDGPETGVTVKIVGDPIKAAAATSEGVRLPDYGTYQVKAVATAEGYANLNGEGEVTWVEPQTAAPEITVTEDGLTVKATGEGTVTLYVVDANGNETAIVNPTTFAQKDEAYTVNLKAVAHVDGAKDGVATKTIIIPAKSTEPGTGVNELVDGKAVKSVRYFNMAGQEMQEVNGVTIVVTTYTDGTTSAVKVMK